jgi:ABC-type dipeptide/oligopeptide/nickel transport system permease component
MKEIIHFLENLIKAEHPLWQTLLISSFIMILAFILSPSTGAKLIDVFFSKKNKSKKQYNKKYFLNHPVFDYFSYNLIRLRSIDFGNTGKSEAGGQR